MAMPSRNEGTNTFSLPVDPTLTVGPCPNNAAFPMTVVDDPNMVSRATGLIGVAVSDVAEPYLTGPSALTSSWPARSFYFLASYPRPSNLLLFSFFLSSSTRFLSNAWKPTRCNVSQRSMVFTCLS